MKFNCKWCGTEIDVSQSEKAKNGLKKLIDHEATCFKKNHPNFEKIMNVVSGCKPLNSLPDKFDMQTIIGYLHQEMGRIPSESEVLRFNMFLGTKPTTLESKNFIKLLKLVRP